MPLYKKRQKRKINKKCCLFIRCRGCAPAGIAWTPAMFNVCPQGVASGDKLFQTKTSARSGIAGQSLKSVAIVLIWIPVCSLLNQASAKQISDSGINSIKKTEKQNDAKLWFTASCETGFHPSNWLRAASAREPSPTTPSATARTWRNPVLYLHSQGSYLCFPSLILPLYGNSVLTILYFLDCAETAEHVHRIS